jgi:alpha-glucuronidase
MTHDPCWLREENSAHLTGRRAALLITGPVAGTLTEELTRATGREPSTDPASTLILKTGDVAGFTIGTVDGTTTITAGTEQHLLHGYFHYLRDQEDTAQTPAFPIRMVNQWDNMSSTEPMGSIERGYAGNSIFYDNGEVVRDKGRIKEFARMLASIGINALSINNVNVHPASTRLLTKHLDEVAEIAGILRGYGISAYLSVNFASPIMLGDLDTADPADPAVVAWWAATAARVYERIPDFGGFLVKADSEGQPGPFSYGRDHADGANLLAKALEPHGGTVFWRCFVYNHRQDWRDRMTDRARAAYDNFMPLDGRFAENVVLQIKYGSMDFQVREPVSPLILGLRETGVVVELQITQEYTGHQIDVCYLGPQWQQILDFDAGAGPVKQLLAGRGRAGLTAVANVGDDENWTGHKLAQANLYGYGRLAWDPGLSPETVLDEWTRLTFPTAAPPAQAVVREIQRGSWPAYESYTAPLGVGWMVAPAVHYGPSVDGYEYSRWGTYHFADRDGVGVDRTVATGTGFAGQYPPARAAEFESLDRCPDELLLFFHHVPYGHVLRSGKTVIQHIYDSHFAGHDWVAAMLDAWRALAGQLEEPAYGNVLGRLERQLDNAREWRDQVNTYFWRKSGIPDARGRTIF